ncbi:MAG: L,D-transpeptidase family protein [Chloroflexi bacterium]|nr:L,D-transpeptidase family protein [Chloroflexota bacterium]
MAKLHRRTVLKWGGTLAVIPFVRILRPVAAQTVPGAGGSLAESLEIALVPRPFGRAIQAGLVLREAPSSKAKLVRQLALNEVVALLGQVNGDGPVHNIIWYQTQEGFVYSAFMQPCENSVNTPLVSVDKDSLIWGEVTVPVTEARAQPGSQAGVRYRLYYSAMVRVAALVVDQENVSWYQVDDGMTNGLFVRAEHIRPVEQHELEPISPDVPQDAKRIEVDLAQQVATAYEDDQPVFSARVATGYAGFRTTPGEHRIFLKTPSRRMIGGARGTNDFYDLPGVGWVSYFTASRIAFHSTYWHNDYGRPRSHGCVNMLPEDAKWVFRWTMPSSPYEERWTRTGAPSEGTLVKVKVS